MKKALGSLVVALAVAFAACGGKDASRDGGPVGAAGNAAGGRGGTGGDAGSGVAGDGGGGTTGAAGSSAGTSGTAGDGGGGAGRGGTTGAGGAGGSAGRGGTTGAGGDAGRGGTTGAAGAGGNAGRGGTTGAGGAGGSAGRGGTTGAGGAGGSAGRGGTTGTGGTGTGGTGGTLGGRCTAPADCGGSLPSGPMFCSPSWSCVDGSCTAECMGGRTCIESPDSGCLRCTTPSTPSMSQGCVGSACVFTAAQVISVERNNGCQASNTPNFDTWHCTGQWATLDGSRTVCTIQVVPTDALRWSISCGTCVTVVIVGINN